MIRIKRIRCVTFKTLVMAVFASSVCAAASLADEGSLDLDGDQIRRLGIKFRLPELSSTLVIASAPAEVVIPQVHQSVISTPVNGIVANLLVAVGDTVESGQPIAEILSVEYMDMQRRFLDAAAAEQLVLTQLARDEDLHAEGIIAERRLHETRAGAESARLATSQALQQLQISGFDEVAVAKLTSGRELSSVVSLRAPMAGAITERYASVGSSLQSLAPVVKLADLGELWLEARLPQEVATRVDRSMQVRTFVNDRPMIGSIIVVGQLVDSVTQSVLVRAVVENTDALLRAGQFLTIEIVADTGGQTVLAVPNGAIMREDGEAYVFVEREGGVERIAVTLLAEGRDRVFIDSSVTEDAQVAVSGVSALKALWLSDEQ